MDRADAIDQIVELYRIEMGTRFPDRVYDDLKRAMADGWKAGTIPVTVDWKKAPAPEQAIEWFARANHFDLGKTFLDYQDEIRAAAVEALKTGDRQKALRKLEESIPGVLGDERLRFRLGDIFRNLQNRAFTFSRVKGIEAAGFTRVEVVAIMDRRTSAICRVMNHKTFEVRTASAFVDEFISTPYGDGFWDRFRNPNWEPTAEEVKAAGGSREKAIDQKTEAYQKMNGDELVAMLGVPVPPYHHRCRSLLVISKD